MSESSLTQPSALAHQFDDLDQQHEADSLGMWVFLGTEVMFFGALFAAFTIYRFLNPAAFAEASRHLDVLLGSINTAVLLGSSLSMALAVYAAQHDRRQMLTVCLLLTAVLGAFFLSIKAMEYTHDFEQHLVPGFGFSYEGADASRVQLFFVLYFVMTGLHAIHITIGIALMLVLAVLSWRGHYSSEHHAPVELSGLYWHFVDIVWVFLFPLLYLLRT